ncbi:Glutathione S-transferase (plasmid) [Azotobacter chroococcum NCIMB 8003]|uniref:Glutathione S-transferase n=1 Tax=Azotobacter chroococcum NCIMB 8003 TaxID=1328314 RepID=A0A0C4WTC7_9GAMM|nr:Glutathione S-transferase [Azotobacter chroococcum NCIMB 8003]
MRGEVAGLHVWPRRSTATRSPCAALNTLALHPFGKIPVLAAWGTAHFLKPPPSAAYLDEAFPQSSLQPLDLARKVEVDQWSAALALYVDDRLIRRYLLLLVFAHAVVTTCRPGGFGPLPSPWSIQTLELLERQFG